MHLNPRLSLVALASLLLQDQKKDLKEACDKMDQLNDFGKAKLQLPEP